MSKNTTLTVRELRGLLSRFHQEMRVASTCDGGAVKWLTKETFSVGTVTVDDTDYDQDVLLVNADPYELDEPTA